MKAEMDGIKLEGTPEEIYKFLELRKNDKFLRENPYRNPMFYPQVTATTDVKPLGIGQFETMI